MRRLSTLVAIAVTGLIMAGCGGDSCVNTPPLVNNDTNNTAQQPDNNQTLAQNEAQFRVVGNAVDGEIAGAVVEILDINDTLLATTTTDTNGSFEANVSDLPKRYKLKVTGGKDKGVDHEANANDEELGFEMGAIVEREESDSNTSMAFVNPATTLVQNIVEEGAIPLEEAEEQVKESFGIDDNRSLCKIDTQKHHTLNRVGNLIALLAKITPVEDKSISIKAIAKVVVKKKIKVSIGDMGVDMDDLNLSHIFDEIEGISDQEVSKLALSQEIVKKQIVKVVTKIQVKATMSNEEQKDVVSSYATLQELLRAIEESSSDELDNEKLALIVDNLESSIQAMLDSSDLNSSDSDTIDLVAKIIKANLSEDVDRLKIKVVQSTKKYQTIKKLKIKKLVKLIYKNARLEDYDKVGEMLDDESSLNELEKSADDIASKVVEEGEIPTQLDDELSDTLASNIAQKVENNQTTPTAIKEANEAVVKNDLLIDTLKTHIKTKVTLKAKKTKLSHEERVQYVASAKVVSSIKLSIHIKTFDETTKQSSEALYATLMQRINDLQNQIKVLELLFVDLSDSFEATKFDQTYDEAQTISQDIALDDTIDRVKTIAKIKIEIEIKVVQKSSVVISVEDNRVTQTTTPRTITLPQPKLPDMPQEFATPITIGL
ncbi:MAG: hypothetical protein KU38_06315 [Sulfurovum sp. FS08-3]|nr:MAG: hypothetical protein KU38_06315 [Sulfurovum sp. FS08-3]